MARVGTKMSHGLKRRWKPANVLRMVWTYEETHRERVGAGYNVCMCMCVRTAHNPSSELAIEPRVRNNDQ